ncbi:MAG: hypothetical protein HYY46_02655 [Deltaproteobacteria bacterium]|nr:hypothetical protein [Deltaproteobacteria bacterium]
MYNLCVILKRILPLVLMVFLCWSGTVLAQYTLVLKNGRRITVQTYREEGGMIKFQGLGGEIGLAKDQIKAILKPGEKEERGMVVPGLEGIRVVPAEAKPEVKEAAAPQAPGEAKPEEKALSPEEKLAEERAKEEKEYQQKVIEITEQIKAARDRYAIATRGTSSAEPTLLNTEEAIKARTEDLSSRLRDARLIPEFRPGATTPGVEVQPPTPSSKEREFSELRNQINQLTRQRETLIEEMRQKGFDTGGLFLD